MSGEAGWLPADRATRARKEWGPNLCLRDRDQPESWPPYPPMPWRVQPPEPAWPWWPVISALWLPGVYAPAEKVKVWPQQRRKPGAQPQTRRLRALWTPGDVTGTLHPERRAVTQGRTPPQASSAPACPLRRPHPAGHWKGRRVALLAHKADPCWAEMVW